MDLLIPALLQARPYSFHSSRFPSRVASLHAAASVAGRAPPTIRVLLHLPRGAPRAAPALLHAGRCARRRLLPCARRTRLSRPPCALHWLRRHRRTPPLRFLPTPRRPVDPASAAKATTQRLALVIISWLLVGTGGRRV